MGPALVTLLATAGLVAQEDLGELLAPIRIHHELPALAAAVVQRGELTALGAVGVRKVGCDEPVTTEDRWYLGSCTKAMTATLVARLVLREELDWDTTLAAVFPGRAAAMHPGFRRATVRQLLDHRAGLPLDRSGGGLLAAVVRSRAAVGAQRLRILDRALTLEPAAAPGTRYAYSNTGFVIAGAVVERKTGVTWEEALERELFGPLGMKSSGFGPPGTPGEVDQPWGHVQDEDGDRPVGPGTPLASAPDGYGPAGSVHATLADWARFVGLHVRGERGASPRLPEATRMRMQTPVAGARYACGFAVGERLDSGSTTLAHHGSNALWHSLLWAAPEDDLAVLVVCNQGGDEALGACDAAVAALRRLAAEDR